jgi:hypothetical protein
MNVVESRVVSNLFSLNSSLYTFYAIITRIPTVPTDPIAPVSPVTVQDVAIVAMAVHIIGSRVVSTSLFIFNAMLA